MRNIKVPMDAEKGFFPCRDCGLTFETGEDFSNHFARLGNGSNVITGCKYNTRDVKKLRTPAAA
jgi:hypothetical protein